MNKLMIVMRMIAFHIPCLFPEKISLTPDQRTHCHLMIPGLKKTCHVLSWWYAGFFVLNFNFDAPEPAVVLLLVDLLSKLSLKSCKRTISSKGISSLVVVVMICAMFWLSSNTVSLYCLVQLELLAFPFADLRQSLTFAHFNPVWRSQEQPIGGQTRPVDQSEANKVQICKVGCWYFYLKIYQNLNIIFDALIAFSMQTVILSLLLVRIKMRVTKMHGAKSGLLHFHK